MHYKLPELNSMVEGRLVDWWILHNNTMQQSQSQFLMIFSLWCGPVSIAVVTRPCWPCWLPQISQICYEAGCQSVWDSETGDYMLHMLGLPDRQETRRPRHLEMFYVFAFCPVSGLRSQTEILQRHHKTRHGVVDVCSLRMFGYWNKWYFSCREQF